jgi:uncharacterized protein (UPF0147 family)
MTKLELAKQAIENLFGDTSVSAAETLDALQELSEDLEMKMDALRCDLRKQE